MSYDRGYDAGASQFAGGGFVPSPSNQGGFSSEPISKRSGNMNQSLRAVTIRMLLKENANVLDERFTVDGVDIHTVTIVGRIVSVQEQSSRAVLIIHDGTAGIEVTHWVSDHDSDLMAAKKTEWQPGAYVRIYGNFKSAEKRRLINAYAIKTITDHNEVTHHFLQCIFQHLHLTRGAPPPPGAATAAIPAGGRAAHGAGPAQGAPEGTDLLSLVMSVYNSPRLANRAGISIDEVHEILARDGHAVSLAQVHRAVEVLANDGRVYSTVDDRSFRSAGLNA